MKKTLFLILILMSLFPNSYGVGRSGIIKEHLSYFEEDILDFGGPRIVQKDELERVLVIGGNLPDAPGIRFHYRTFTACRPNGITFGGSHVRSSDRPPKIFVKSRHVIRKVMKILKKASFGLCQ